MQSANAPDASTEPPRGAKRKRQILSCFECKSRKLKCDRAQPACSRCRQSGKAASCSYDDRYPLKPEPDAHPTPQKPAWSLNNAALYVRRDVSPDGKELRVASYRSPGPEMWRLAGGDDCPVANANGKVMTKGSPSSGPTETMIFRGAHFKTQYYGGSNATSILAHFPELRSFMKEAIMLNASLPFIQKDLKALQIKWKHEKTPFFPLNDSELLQLLPNRETVDHLVGLYFDTFETMHRILHRPSFWAEYRQFWDDQATVRPAFVIILLLIMAAVSCVSTREVPTYVGDSSLGREHAIKWVEVAEWWLGRHSHKNVYMAVWQVRCLIVLAKQVNVIKKKRTWTEAGNLVREAMSAGFHRDPALLGENASPFEQEMRRRLWSTMVELELHISIDRGMPSASAGLPFDCAAPLNINDEDFAEDSVSVPPGKPWTEHTDSSFAHISRASFSLRVSLASLTNDLSPHISYDDALKFEESVTKELQRLPALPAQHGSARPGKMPVLARTVLDLQLRQFLILLHAPFARQADGNSRHSLSRMVSFNTAASILKQHAQLTGSNAYLLPLLRNDYFRASLVTCHHVFTTLSINSANPFPDFASSLTLLGDLVLTLNTDGLLGHIEAALALLEERITRLGTGYTHYWYTSAACTFLRAALYPDEASGQRQLAIDRVARQYHRVLSSQVPFAEAKDKLFPPQRFFGMSSGDAQVQASNGPDISSLDPTAQAAFNAADVPLDEYFFGDPSAWTFENLWSLE